MLNKRWINRILVSIAVGAAVWSLVAGSGDHGWLHKWGVKTFGPPSVVMAEAYTDSPAAPATKVDHSTFDSLLKKHVDPDGWVDYELLSKDADQLDRYIALLADVPFAELSRDDKLALLINAYNAFTLRLILDYYPIDSIRDIPEAKRWDHKRWHLAGKTYSLNQIEHELIRAKFKEPRIHFALVCAAYSCPKLRNEAYVGEQLEKQLSDQTAYTHSHPRWYRFDKRNNTLYLTALYDWYGDDFKAVADSVLDYVADQAPEVRRAIDAGQKPTIKWLDYDWKLNDISNAP